MSDQAWYVVAIVALAVGFVVELAGHRREKQARQRAERAWLAYYERLRARQ